MFKCDNDNDFRAFRIRKIEKKKIEKESIREFRQEVNRTFITDSSTQIKLPDTIEYCTQGEALDRRNIRE